MTQLTEEHFILHSQNKDKLHKQNKLREALISLNNQIDRVTSFAPEHKELDDIGNELTDILVDIKIATGIDV
jgi:GTP1/Obg family GTP-binding protein